VPALMVSQSRRRNQLTQFHLFAAAQMDSYAHERVSGVHPIGFSPAGCLVAHGDVDHNQAAVCAAVA
jgi:hypothetical protein